MGEGYNFQQLRAEILKRSRATEWDVAPLEWALTEVYEADEDETCLCGHFPIREICVIHNSVTHESTEVGNVCVKRFLGLRSDLIFQALKRIRKDPTKSLNKDSIVFFHEKNLFNSREYTFLQSTLKKSNLSSAQIRWRVAINERLLDAIARRGFQGVRTPGPS
jgi:hypothetical protein